MKPKLKIIISTSVAVILLTVTVILNIPHNLKNALNFDKSEQIIIAIVTSKNIGGQPILKAENFTFEKRSAEFTAINKLLDGYSYFSTAARDINGQVSGIYMATITIIDDNNSGLYLINSTGSNIIVNGTNYRMNQNKIEELIGKILGICGM